MSRGSNGRYGPLAEGIFDFTGTEAEQLSSGRIPDPLPEHTPFFRWIARVLGRAEEFLRARGGTWLRKMLRILWSVLIVAGLVLLVGPIINKSMDLDEVIAASTIDDVEWIAKDAVIDYEVSRDGDGSFRTGVTERYSAVFTNGDEPRIVRSIITELNGHDTEFALTSATVDGNPAEVTLREGATTTDIVVQREGGAPFSGTHEIALSYSLGHLIDDTVDEVAGVDVDEWRWPLFGPSWTQATSGLDVSITLTPELDDALVRRPFATLGWLIVSDSVWLTAEAPTADVSTADGVRYAFSNDDNLPPNSHAWVRFTFADGTFAQPPTTLLFWVFTWGPLIPLALLAVIMLAALAARRIVWADTAGNPWFVARSEPPEDLGPLAAAELLGRRRHAELVQTLTSTRVSADAESQAHWVTRVAEAGRRAGRLGALPTVWSWGLRWRSAEGSVGRGLRWRPNGYLFETFVLAPIAVSLIQLGILRQLSAQYVLLVVWWPFVFVAASILIAVVALWAVTGRRPLTREGALVVQQLRGIGVYAERTNLVERGPLDDALMPYAVQFVHPRRAGVVMEQLAVRETGDREVARGWRTSYFLSAPALLGFMAALGVLAVSVTVAATVKEPYAGNEYLTWPSSTARGAMWSQLEGFDIAAELSRGDDGGARIDTTEQLRVQLQSGGGSVPQFEREWPRSRYGQELGLEVTRVTFDGEPVPFTVTDGERTSKLTTAFTDVRDGTFDVEVEYALTSPAVEVRDPGSGKFVQQVRWGALLWFWDDTYYANPEKLSAGTAPLDPMRIEFTVAPELADETLSGGWIAHEPYGSNDYASQPYENGGYFTDWVSPNTVYLYDESKEFGEAGHSTRYEILIGDETVRVDGAPVYTIDPATVQSRLTDWDHIGENDPGPFVLNSDVNETLGKHELRWNPDLGTVLNFSDGTFTNVTPGSYRTYRAIYAAPLTSLIVLTAGVLLLAAVPLWAAVSGARGIRREKHEGLSGKLTSFGTLPVLAVAQTVLFWWTIGGMPGDSAVGGWMIVFGLAMWAVVIAQWLARGLMPWIASRRGRARRRVTREHGGEWEA